MSPASSLAASRVAHGTIRAVYDADGVAIGTEDVEPVADIGPTPESGARAQRNVCRRVRQH